MVLQLTGIDSPFHAFLFSLLFFVLFVCVTLNIDSRRWALGVLIYYMLEGEMPFGSWRQNELDTFQKIAKGQLTFPRALSSEAQDLITKVSLISHWKLRQSYLSCFTVFTCVLNILCSCLKLMKTCGSVAKEVLNQSRNIPGSMDSTGERLVAAEFKFLKR